MKYITVIAILAGLWSGSSNPHSLQVSSSILEEALFIQVARDMELLSSWLMEQGYTQETIKKVRHQGDQSILALYNVDPQTFQESVTYYLTTSLERALQTYDKIYAAVEALLPSS